MRMSEYLGPSEEEAYPNMCEHRIERFLTVSASSLGDKCYERHEDPHETILENTKPDDLRNRLAGYLTLACQIALTLNSVSPLLGVLVKFPQHPLNHWAGHIQGRGGFSLKKSF